MRRKLLSGAHEWIGAEELINSLMVWMLSARNISGSFRFVMSSVLDGGVGMESAGRVDRSIDMFDLLSALEAERDDCAELSEDILKFMGSIKRTLNEFRRMSMRIQVVEGAFLNVYTGRWRSTEGLRFLASWQRQRSRHNEAVFGN